MSQYSDILFLLVFSRILIFFLENRLWMQQCLKAAKGASVKMTLNLMKKCFGMECV